MGATFCDMKYALISLLLATPALADCPPAPNIIDAESALFDRIREAPNEMAARPLSNELWALWTLAPDAQAQELLERGMRARGSYNYLEARDAFDRLTEYCPEYAEGFNQRAFVNFLTQNFTAALVDLDRAIELSPRHVGAISGKALTLIGLGREEEAQEVLREAVGLNPWLSERHLLKEPDGEDL